MSMPQPVISKNYLLLRTPSAVTEQDAYHSKTEIRLNEKEHNQYVIESVKTADIEEPLSDSF